MLSISRNITVHTSRAAALAGASLALSVGFLCGLCNLDRLGDYFMNQGEYREAIPFYTVMTQAASAVAPHHHRLADAWTNLGVCYERLGQRVEADQAQRIALDFRRQNNATLDTVATAADHGGMQR